jgi:hypothetical protein
MTLLNAGAGATFTGDAASADGWNLNTANDTLWIGDTTTGIRICVGNVSGTLKYQTIEYDPGVLLKVTGPAATVRFYCYSSPTDIAGELDISALTSLTHMNCQANSITTLDVANLTSLISLSCSSNLITVLDVSALTNLTILYCYTNSISTLNVTALTSLTDLRCYGNTISVLDIGGLTSLVHLMCSNTDITSMTANAFDNLDSLQRVYWYNCALVTAVVDQCIWDFFNDRVAKAAMTELKLAGDNSPCTGTYQEPADHNNPVDAAKAAWVLVNDYGWTVEINTV